MHDDRMLFHREILKKIKDGKVKMAFRRWDKPAVKAGRTQKTKVGVLQFIKITPVPSIKSLTIKDAKAAGYENLEDLIIDLSIRETGKIYKISLKYAGEDPRIKLRENNKLTKEEITQIISKLQRLDKSSPLGPWTKKVLKAIQKNPGVTSRKVAPTIGFEDYLKYKINVRKLKALGLTISLDIGYKLSPRGKVIYKAYIK